MGGLREIAAPFVAAPPTGARVRTRLRVVAADAAVLRAVGRHLGSLASADLADRCREGLLDAPGRARSRRDRKRALAAASSSRWAGALTRASEDQWQLAWRNLGAETATLRARARVIEGRLAVAAGTRTGRARGYVSQAERFSKQQRLQALRARLAAAGQRTAAGRVSVVRGGRRLLRARANLTAAGLTQAQWRERQRAAQPVPAVVPGQASTRDGRIRAAVSALIGVARQHGARAVVIENLNFAQAREQGREQAGNRPSRGRRGRAFRALVSGIPTGRFRDRLAQMTGNAGLTVIAVDPAYTTRWGAEHWLAPLQQQAPVPVSGHHAAAVVTGPAQRARPPDQAAEDRSRPPDSQDNLLLSQ